MGIGTGCGAKGGNYGDRPSPVSICYFSDRIHFTSAFTSSSFTPAFGGIITGPQTPEPPFFTFSTSIASAFASPLYLAATSLYAGPTSFLSTWWQAVQPLLVASSRLAS